MRAALAFLVVSLLGAGPAAAEAYRDSSVTMQAVSDFDLNRYLGLWYEIARFPNRFEKGCEAVTAEYAMREDGQVAVTNTCREGALDGPIKTANGVARVEGPGRLSVSFVRWLPFARGAYWVLYVNDDYSVAAVGAPRGKTGWILARSPRIDAASRKEAEAALRANGYNTDLLRDVAQPEG